MSGRNVASGLPDELLALAIRAMGCTAWCMRWVPPSRARAYRLARAPIPRRRRRLPERERALGRHAKVPVGPFGGHPAPGGPLQEPQLQQVGLVDVLDGLGLLADARRERRQADRPALELADQREQD